jgi:outer membrane protein assembly factor BamD (BamD/ComL family)
MWGHRVAWWTILAAAVALRLALFSGYGLGDDPNYFVAYHGIYESGTINPGAPYDFRFAFWIPVVLFMKIFGVTEWGFVGFVTLCSIVNVALVYLLARQEWHDERIALVGMAVMAALPLEVLSSTLFVIDIPLATYCYAALWLYRESVTRQRWSLAVLAGAFLFLGYSAKQWGLLIGAVFAVEAISRWRASWKYSAWCVGTLGALVAGYFSWQWLRFRDPLYDVHLVRSVAIFLPHSRDIVLDYSKMLWLPTQYGSWFAGWYPHLLIVLGALCVRRTTTTGKWLLYFLIELACLSAVPAHYEKGQWVLLVPHIFRYLCFLSIPLALAVTAYLGELLRWRPRLGYVVVALLLGVSVLHAVELTRPTRDVFGEQRRANALLRESFEDETVVSDFGFTTRYEHFHDGPWPRLDWIRNETPEGQAAELARVRDAVVVTGGGRLPWYGCPRCATSIQRFTPPASWRLVREYDERELSSYRTEPLRIWRVSEAARRAGELLRDTADDASRLALVRGLVQAGDSLTAIEAGHTLLEQAAERDVELLYLVGISCGRAGKASCASRRLAESFDRGLGRDRMREAALALMTAATARGRHDEARAWVERYRTRFPEAADDPAFVEVDSGMAEAIMLYHEGRLRDARASFGRIRRDPTTPYARRAQYFYALAFFRERDLDAALRETAAYRARYGEDEATVELAFRHAEVLRETDPVRARELFADVAERYPGTYWATEAMRQLEHLAPATPPPGSGDPSQ